MSAWMTVTATTVAPALILRLPVVYSLRDNVSAILAGLEKAATVVSNMNITANQV